MTRLVGGLLGRAVEGFQEEDDAAYICRPASETVNRRGVFLRGLLIMAFGILIGLTVAGALVR
jgi:hypothetical protein